MRIGPVVPLLMVVTASLTACAHNFDSVAKLNDIPFGGTNDSNIAAMVANPADLVRGRGETDIDAKTVVTPIQRVQLDAPKKLLNPGGNSGGGGSGGGGSGGGGSGGGGTGGSAGGNGGGSGG